MFGMHGLAGFLTLVAVLVTVWICLGWAALTTQRENQTNFIKVEEPRP